VFHYLIDSSVASDFYRPPKSFLPAEDYPHHRLLQEYVTRQTLYGQGIVFIACFCITEVLNTFARWWFREKGVFDSGDQYSLARNTFINHVRERKSFYSYDMTRYHNINSEKVFRVEHRIKLTRGKHMSGLDILVIAMGMELKRICGNEIHLLTKDYRQAEIANKKPTFPKAYYWPETPVSDLPHV